MSKINRSNTGILYVESKREYFDSVADSDPGSGEFFDPWIRDLGRVRNQDPDPRSTSPIIFPRAYKQFLD